MLWFRFLFLGEAGGRPGAVRDAGRHLAEHRLSAWPRRFSSGWPMSRPLWRSGGAPKPSQCLLEKPRAASRRRRVSQLPPNVARRQSWDLSRSALWYHGVFKLRGFSYAPPQGATCEARRVASRRRTGGRRSSAGVLSLVPPVPAGGGPPGTQAALERGGAGAAVPTIDRGAPLIYPNSRVRAVPRVGPVNKPIENSAIFGRVVCVSICQGGGRCNHFVFKQPNR